jgi:hypothetical protein
MEPIHFGMPVYSGSSTPMFFILDLQVATVQCNAWNSCRFVGLVSSKIIDQAPMLRVYPRLALFQTIAHLAF